MVSLNELFARVDEAGDEIISLLCELIRFPTVNTGVMPTGDELPLCRFLEDRLRSEGIETQLYRSAEQRGNLVARLPGNGGKTSLLFMGHVDVVPPGDESRWRFPPFAGTVADGRVWGRGAADMKDMVTAEVMALLILKRAGVTLGGDLVLASCSDEESGGKYGFGWLAQNEPDSIRTDFALNEGNSAPIANGAGLAFPLAVGEKGRLEIQITLKGKGAHAATPWQGDNVSFKLGELLKRLEAYRPEVDTSHDFFSHVLPILGRSELITPENVDALAERVMGTNRGLASNLLGLSRMTLTPTMFSGGIKSNSVPEAGKLICDVRTLPHQDESYVRAEVERLLAGIEGASYELFYTAVPGMSPVDTELAGAVQRALVAATGHAEITLLPSLVTGFTDARLVRPLGTVVYNFGPTHPDADPAIGNNMHGVDESTDVRSVLLKTKVLLAVACDILGVR